MKFKSTILRTWVVTFVVATFCSCGTVYKVPVTGRKQRLVVNDSEVLALSFQQYSQYMQSAKLSSNATQTAMVKRVGQRIANAVETYLNNNGYSSEVQKYQWEFNLVADGQANAWCLPGGKIVVYEGILPLTETEAGLAVVLGHEVAHAVARHSAEQMSSKYKAQYGGQILSSVLSSAGASSATVSSAATLYNLGNSLTQLSYSRSNESEADHMGLVFTAMAGYNPNEAISFWQRMSQRTSSSTPQFLSTHPSDEKRIENIKKHLPDAMNYYNATLSPTTAKSTKSTKSTKKTKKTTTKTTGGYRIGN
ncbi:MAG: M48 family metallopeptidase [Bacteroidaceae bacterium]|nr:M48 family metallopeptidase [Bacteroidaceae bacterium]